MIGSEIEKQDDVELNQQIQDMRQEQVSSSFDNDMFSSESSDNSDFFNLDYNDLKHIKENNIQHKKNDEWLVFEDFQFNQQFKQQTVHIKNIETLVHDAQLNSEQLFIKIDEMHVQLQFTLNNLKKDTAKEMLSENSNNLDI